jgi:outer membrane immunogenic protein
MLRRILLTTTAVAALSGASFAADLPSRAPVAYAPPPVFTWTGFYVGVAGGYIGSTTKTTNEAGFNFNIITGDSFRSRSGGALISGEIGYNYQIGSIVLGVEADYGYANGTSSFNHVNFSQQGESRIESFGTVRGRLGYAFDRTLLYVTGGFAFANVKQKTFLFTDDAGCRASFSGMKSGWTVGGGIEHMFTEHLSGKIEGLYANLGKKSGANSCGCRFGFKNEVAVVRAGLNYKF